MIYYIGMISIMPEYGNVYLWIFMGLIISACPSGLLTYAAEKSGDVMKLVEIAYPNTFKYIDGELDTMGKFKEYLVNEKNVLLGKGLAKADPEVVKVIARIDGVEKEIKDLTKLRNNIQSDLITLTNDNAVINAFKEKLGSLSDAELQARLAEAQKLKKKAGLVVSGTQRNLRKNRDVIAITGNNADQKQLRYASHVTKIDLARQNAVKGKLNSEVTAIQQLLNHRRQLAQNASKVGVNNGVIARTIGKGAGLLGYLPLPSTLRDIKDDFTGKKSQDYINEYEASLKNNRSKITLIDRKITSLKNRISEIEYRNRNMTQPHGSMRGDDRPYLQKQINVLNEERGQLETDMERLNGLILEKSLQGDTDMLNQPNKFRTNRLNPVQS